LAPKFHKLNINQIRRDTPDSVAISFTVPQSLRRDFSFTPGQYLTLRTTIDGKDVRRPYSISSPVNSDHLTVGVRCVDDGVFSSFANKTLKAGDDLLVMTPEGRFTAKCGQSAKYLLLAAGSGITPMISIAASTLQANESAEITLVYGNRQTDTIMFRRALEVMKDRYMGRLTIVHLLSREEQDVPLLNGRIDAAKIAALARTGGIDPIGADGVFLCGPGEMIDQATVALNNIGVAPDKIRIERFTPADGQQPRAKPSNAAAHAAAKGASVEIILDGTRKKFAVNSAGESVLEAAARQGLDLPFSCKGGMCCTCRCKVVRGSAEMALNYSLEKWETDAGFTLACQARATSDDLVLDFDAL